jgi:hypothetical protein
VALAIRLCCTPERFWLAALLAPRNELERYKRRKKYSQVRGHLYNAAIWSAGQHKDIQERSAVPLLAGRALKQLPKLFSRD